MRVLYLTDNLSENGTVRILRDWILMGKEKNLLASLVIRPSSRLGPWLRDHEIPYTFNRLPLPDLCRPLPSLWSVAKLAAWCRYRKVSIIHCNEHNTYPFGVLLRKVTGLPLVCHVRYRMSREYCEWAFGGPERQPDALLWTSQQQQRDNADSVQGLVPLSKQHLVYIGLSLDTFGSRSSERQTVRQSWSVGDDDIVIGQASVIQPRKRIEDFVALIAQLASVDSRVLGLLAGDAIAGDELYRDQVLRMISACGLGNRFRVLGNIKDVEQFYHGIDLYVSTSEYETFGNSVCEAMSCSRMVVAYEGGSVREILGNSGIVVANSDLIALTQVVGDAIRNPCLRQYFGTLGRQRVLEVFNPRQSLDQLLTIYDRLGTPESHGQS